MNGPDWHEAVVANGIAGVGVLMTWPYDGEKMSSARTGKLKGIIDMAESAFAADNSDTLCFATVIFFVGVLGVTVVEASTDLVSDPFGRLVAISDFFPTPFSFTRRFLSGRLEAFFLAVGCLLLVLAIVGVVNVSTGRGWRAQ